MSAPSFVNSASAAQTTAGTSLTCNVPASVSNGDLLLAFVGIAATSATANTPGGWTKIDSLTADTRHTAIFARIASSEPASYAWTVSGSSEYCVIVHAYRPSSGSWSDVHDALAIVWSQRNASTTTHGVPALALDGTGYDMVDVTFFSLGRGSTTTTKPASHTLAENPDSGGSGTSATECGGAYLIATPGTAPAVNWTTTNANVSQTWHIAVVDPGHTDIHGIRGFAGRQNTVTPWSASNAASLTVPLPYANPNGSDLYLLMVALSKNDTTTLANLQTPSGWALDQSLKVTVSGADDRLVAFSRIADGTEGGSVTISLSSGTCNWAGGALALSQFASLVTSIAHDSTADTTWSVPALTMTAVSPYTPIIAVVQPLQGDNLGTTAPGGYVALWESHDGAVATAAEIAVAYKIETGSNPSATSFTGPSAYANIGLHIGPGAPPPTATPRAWGYIMG